MIKVKKRLIEKIKKNVEETFNSGDVSIYLYHIIRLHTVSCTTILLYIILIEYVVCVMWCEQIIISYYIHDKHCNSHHDLTITIVHDYHHK